MPRPPRKLSGEILSTLTQRPKLRFTLTQKGVKAFEAGESGHQSELDSLVDAIDANNKQPVSMQTWKQFHKPKQLTNPSVRNLVQDRFITIIARSKFSFVKG
jgi:hypothetical protein